MDRTTKEHEHVNGKLQNKRHDTDHRILTVSFVMVNKYVFIGCHGDLLMILHLFHIQFIILCI